MTCIVGVVDKTRNITVIGGDSSATAGNQVVIRKDPKVFINGNFIIGGCGSFRMIQILQFTFKPPEINGKEIYEYLCTDFVNELINCFRKTEVLQTYQEGGAKCEKILLAYKDRLFLIDEDFQVAENENGIDAIGCGDDYALGALRILKDINIPTEEKVFKALEAASYYSPSVTPPFTIITT